MFSNKVNFGKNVVNCFKTGETDEIEKNNAHWIERYSEGVRLRVFQNFP